MDLLLFELQNTPQIRHLSPLHKGGGKERGYLGCFQVGFQDNDIKVNK